MSRLLETIPVTEQAARAAAQAASRAGVTVRELDDMEDILKAVALFDQVWEANGDDHIVPSNLARALALAGSCFAGAFVDEEIAGAVLGIVGMRDGHHLHSHVLAVRPQSGSGGIGFALKQYQRSWALANGVDPVIWTFDPLVRRNAYFNLCKLGAEIIQYHVNFYGNMSDGLNSGDESDRVTILWRLTSDRAISASEGPVQEPDIEALLATGAVVSLDEDAEGAPVRADTDASVLLCRVPPDAVALRQSNPSLAMDWRKALRETMGRALGDGYVATGITKSGWYVLERKSEK